MKMLIKKIAHLLISSIVLVSSLFTACKKSSDTVAADSFAKAMVVHADVNAPAIDFFIDGAKINKDSIVYGAYTPYTDVKITPNTKTQFKIGLTKLGTFLYSDSTTLTENTGITYYVVLDTLSKTPIVLVTSDDLSAPTAGNAKFRFIHLVSDAITYGFDVELVKPGGAVTPDASNNTFSNLRFKIPQTNFALKPVGSYDVLVKSSGTTNILARIPNITLAEGKIYTLVARGFIGKTNGFGATLVNNN